MKHRGPQERHIFPGSHLLTVAEAKLINYPLVYALSSGRHRGIFYIGSTDHPASRFGAHDRCETKNNHLLRHLVEARKNGNLIIHVLVRHPRDRYAAERDKIFQFVPWLANISNNPMKASGALLVKPVEVDLLLERAGVCSGCGSQRDLKNKTHCAACCAKMSRTDGNRKKSLALLEIAKATAKV